MRAALIVALGAILLHAALVSAVGWEQRVDVRDAHADECRAIEALASSMDITLAKDGSADCCHWHVPGHSRRRVGIRCGGGRVQHIYFQSVGAAGTVPDVFEALPQLQSLSIQDNPDLAGALPTSAMAVENLSMGNTGVSLPAELPADQPCYLQGIAMSNSRTCVLPAWLQRCHALQSLTARSCHLRELPPLWPPNIVRLELNNNALGSLHLRGLSQLRNLYAGYNPLTMPLADLRLEDTCTTLVDVNLADAGLTGTLPAALSACFTRAPTGTASPSLVLHDNALEGSVPAAWGNMTRLENLDLSWNALHGALPADLGALKHLVRVELAGNALTSVPGHLVAEWTALEVLDVARNPLGHPLPREWLEHPTLRNLDAHVCGLTGDMWYDFVGAPLEVLDLHDNELEWDVLLGGFDHLLFADLSGNQFTGVYVPTDLARVSTVAPQLFSLNLANNAFPPSYSVGSIALHHFHPLLISLDLSNNTFAPEPLPIEWKALRHLETLRVHDSGLRATTQNSSGVECVQVGAAKQPMCFPAWLRPSSPVRRDTYRLCYGLEATAAHSTLSINLGAEYFDDTNCECMAGSYRDTDTQLCEACLPHGVCIGEEAATREHRPAMHAEVYYWATPSADAPQFFLPCHHRRCSVVGDGGEWRACAAGHTGRLCSACEDNHFRIGAVCVQCTEDDSGVVLPMLMVLAFCAYIVFIVRRKPAVPVREHEGKDGAPMDVRPVSGVFKMLLFHGQVLTAISKADIRSTLVFGGAASVGAPFLFEPTGIECVSESWSHETAFWMLLALPPAAVVLVGLAAVLGPLVRPLRTMWWRVTMLRLLLTLLYSAYFPLLSTMSVLPCERDPATGRSYFATAPNERCNDGMRAAAGVALVVYGVGIPAGFAWALARFRNTRRGMQVLGWLFLNFRELWAWELVVLARRVLIAVLLSVQPLNNSAPVMLCLGVLVASALLQQRFQPYVSPLGNRLELASLLTLSFTAAVVMAAFDDDMTGRTPLLWLAVLANVGAVVAMLTAMSRGMLDSVRARGQGPSGSRRFTEITLTEARRSWRNSQNMGEEGAGAGRESLRNALLESGAKQ